MPALRPALAAALTALTLGVAAGCASTGQRASDGPEVPVVDPDSPTTGTVDPDPPDPEPDPVSVSLPTLPIGGGSFELDGVPGVVCADVNWLWPSDDPTVPDGVSVSVHEYVVDPPVFEVVDQDCGAAPCLAGFAFTPDSLSCTVALRSLAPSTPEQDGEDAVLRLGGEMVCPSEPCELDQAGDAGDTEVFLEAPYVDEASESPTDEATTESPGDDVVTDAPTDESS